MRNPRLCISIVSHGQGDLIKPLLRDLSKANFSGFSFVDLIITLNVPEDEEFLSEYDAKCQIIRNLRPLGFGANHNQAFAFSECDFFLVLNPDIRLGSLSFKDLLCDVDTNFGVLAPIVLSPNGKIEDSIRRYPNTLRLLKRIILSKREPDYQKTKNNLIKVDWVAGMFMLFRNESFKHVSGFDTKYFMYLEDADICRRLNKSNFSVICNLKQKVIHNAQRKSFRNRQHLKWHIRSMFRFIYRI